MTSSQTPRLTDQAVSELPLAAARAELLEEIMSAPVTESPSSVTLPAIWACRSRSTT